MKSLKKVKIPVIIAGVQATVTRDIPYDIPLLLSKEVMRKAKTQTDIHSWTPGPTFIKGGEAMTF